MLSLSPFQLTDLSGASQQFSGDRPSVVCFVKEDCPTCREVMPVLAVMYDALASSMDFLVLGQTAQGNVTLQQDFNLPFSLLDDSDLKVSFATDVETVPTLLVTD
ncbi:MAG: TlpA family protein disulfide reductase, partial [Pseudomonadota bacterium]|nr:TlpA family protein disulfide reductase [Pseudomonadota bacterium]